MPNILTGNAVPATRTIAVTGGPLTINGAASATLQQDDTINFTGVFTAPIYQADSTVAANRYVTSGELATAGTGTVTNIKSGTNIIMQPATITTTGSIALSPNPVINDIQISGTTILYNTIQGGGTLSLAGLTTIDLQLTQLGGARLARFDVPAYGNATAIGINRYVTSGELPTGTGTGNVSNTASVYWTGAQHVFSSATTIQISGLSSWGSTGGTRISPQGDVQVSGVLRGYKQLVVQDGLDTAPSYAHTLNALPDSSGISWTLLGSGTIGGRVSVGGRAFFTNVVNLQGGTVNVIASTLNLDTGSNVIAQNDVQLSGVTRIYSGQLQRTAGASTDQLRIGVTRRVLMFGEQAPTDGGYNFEVVGSGQFRGAFDFSKNATNDATTFLMPVNFQQAAAGESVTFTSVPVVFAGAVAGATVISPTSDVQISGQGYALSYNSVFNRTNTGGQRYVISGELAGVAGAGTVTNIKAGTNITLSPAAAITTTGTVALSSPLTGPLYADTISAATRFVVSGELATAGTGTVTSFVAGSNITLQPGTITTTGSVALNPNPNVTSVTTAQLTDTGGLIASGTSLFFAPAYQASATGGNRLVTSGELSGGNPGLQTLNTLTAATQTFATGSTGTDFNISSASSTHTFNIPSATQFVRGVLTTSSQTISGVKTWVDNAVFTGTTQTSGVMLAYAPYYQGSQTAAQRYIVSGELSSGGGTGNVSNTASVYWTGAQHVFSSTTTVTHSGLTLFGTTGGTSISPQGDVQLSGTTALSYAPIYQGSVTAAQRYVTSGELPTGTGTGNVSNTASVYWTGAQHVFSSTTTVTHSGLTLFGTTGGTSISPQGDVQVSGSLTTYFTITVASGFVQVGPLATTAVNLPPGGLTTPLVFYGAVQGNVVPIAAIDSYGPTNGPFFVLRRARSLDLAISRDPAAGVISGDPLGGFSFRGWDGQNFRQTALARAIVADVVGSGSIPTAFQFVVGKSGASASPAAMVITTSGTVGNAAAIGIGINNPTTPFHVAVASLLGANTQVSGTLLSYAPIYQAIATGPQRYVTSGELPTGAGTGNVSNTASVYWTGATHVFSSATAVQISGLASWGSTGGTRISPQGDVQLSGTTALSYAPIYQGSVTAAQRYVVSGELATAGTGTVTSLVAGSNITLQPGTITTTGSVALNPNPNVSSVTTAQLTDTGGLIASGTSLFFAPAYQASATGGNRLVTSGELSGGNPGLQTLNTLTAATQTFATGSTGTDFNISSASSTHTFNIPSATQFVRGVLTTSSQTISGVKTWVDNAVFTGTTQASGTLLSYAPIYQAIATGPQRYVTSGELSASTGVSNTASVYWTGATHVFSSATAVQTSGLASWGSAGGTRISPQGDVQVSGVLMVWDHLTVSGDVTQAGRRITLESELDARTDARVTDWFMAEALNTNIRTPVKQSVTLATNQDTIHALAYGKNALWAITSPSAITPQVIKFDPNNLTIQTSGLFTDDLNHRNPTDAVYIPQIDRVYAICPGNTRTTIVSINPDTLAMTDAISDAQTNGQKLTSDGTNVYFIVTGNPNSFVRKYDLATLTLQASGTLTGLINGNCIRYDGANLYAVGGGTPQGWVARITPSTLAITSQRFLFSDTGPTDDMAMAGNYLFVGLEQTAGFGILRIDKTTLGIDRLFTGILAETYGITFDGRWVWAVFNTSPGTLGRLDPETLEWRTYTFGTGENATNEIISDGQRLFVTHFLTPAIVSRVTLPDLQTAGGVRYLTTSGGVNFAIDQVGNTAIGTAFGAGVQVSGTTIAYMPIYGNSAVSAANRFVTSGELATAGTGNVSNTASVYWTGARHVFSSATTVQTSGLSSWGSAGGTRISPQGDVQVSGVLRGYKQLVVQDGLDTAPSYAHTLNALPDSSGISWTLLGSGTIGGRVSVGGRAFFTNVVNLQGGTVNVIASTLNLDTGSNVIAQNDVQLSGGALVYATLGVGAPITSSAINLAVAGQITVSGNNPQRPLVLTAAGGAPTTYSGCKGPNQYEFTNSRIDYWALDLPSGIESRAFWNIQMPDSWDGSTVSCRVIWSTPSGLIGQNTWFGLKARGYVATNALDQAYGTEILLSGTVTAQDTVHITNPVALTIGGSAQAGAYVVFNVGRKTAVGDNMIGNSRLLAIYTKYGVRTFGD